MSSSRFRQGFSVPVKAERNRIQKLIYELSGTGPKPGTRTERRAQERAIRKARRA